MKRQFSIKWKIILMFFTVFLLTISSILFVSTWMNTKNVKNLAKEQLVEKTNGIKSIIENFFDEKALQAKAVAKNQYIIDFLKTGNGIDVVHSILESQFNEYNQFENYFVANTDGLIAASAINRDQAEGLDIKGFPFWRLSTEKDDYHLDSIVYESPVTGKLVTVLAVRVEDADGAFLGLVCMPVFWDDFIAKNIITQKVGSTGAVTLLDENMRVIASTDEKLMLADLSKFDFVKKAYESESGFMRYFSNINNSNIWKYTAYNLFKKTAWKISVSINEDEFISQIKAARNVMIGLGIAIFLLASVLIYLFVNGISVVIKTITEGANRFSVGDIELKGMNWDMIKKINERNDELGDTGKAFAKLIGYQSEKVSMAEKIANGDLNVDVTVSSEEDKLGKALSLMVESLNNLVGEVNGAIDQVSSGSNQVAQASQELSQGATEQASSLEEITSSITEISSQSKQNTDNAVEVSGLSKKAMENAEDGNSKMKELVTAMSGINNYTAEIKRIVKIIDDIAFQTNLLALNANVEAARAGKYGKGFAVVAEEVRNLASRSADSVSETTDMVENAVKSIDECNRLVDITAKGLEDIMESANKVADLVEEISVASKEQTQGLDQINQGLGQIDQVTQATTASAEESASAAEELSGQAQQLKGIINKFKLKKEASEKTTNNKFEELVKKEFGNDRMIDNEKLAKAYKNLVSPKDIIKLDDEDFGQF